MNLALQGQALSRMSDRVVVEVSKRGKLFVGEPYFVPGTPIVLDRKGLDGARRHRR